MRRAVPFFLTCILPEKSPKNNYYLAINPFNPNPLYMSTLQTQLKSEVPVNIYYTTDTLFENISVGYL